MVAAQRTSSVKASRSLSDVVGPSLFAPSATPAGLIVTAARRGCTINQNHIAKLPLEKHRLSQMDQEMEQDLSDRIRERAYEIWIASGYRDGEAEQHWVVAEREILSALQCAAVGKASAKRIRGRATSKLSKARAE